jgi:hypothetical protein
MLRPGLSLGDLREELYRAEEKLASSGEGASGIESEALAGALHVFGMALIQIAQELNESKHLLAGLIAHFEEQREDTKPFIH